MELLTGAVVFVQRDDCLSRQLQGGPLEDKVHPLVIGPFAADLPGIMGRIQLHQKRRIPQCLDFVQDPGQKGQKVLLAVLGAFAVFNLQKSALLGQVGGNCGETVRPLIGA